MNDFSPRVLLTGATGFIGGRLLRSLESRNIRPRCLVRSAKRFQGRVTGDMNPVVVEGDLLRPDTLLRAMEGIDTAYYLVHSMGGRNVFQYKAYLEQDLQAARNFTKAAEASGVKRIIYLGGLGEMADNLSDHLRSRQMVAQILQSTRIQTTVLRAANIIGAGGAPFEMLRHLVERLPVMICPRWVDTRCQPIAVENVIEYLEGCLFEPKTAGGTFDIGGHEIMTYRQLMITYARIRRLRRLIITVPVLTPHLSSYWINLVSTVPAGVVMPLVEGLKNEVVCKNDAIRALIPIRLISMDEAIRTALSEMTQGTEGLVSCQSCLRS
ncbi:MAG: NAD(P)H-binding protein [Syntrophobacteraceae bacterium]